MYNGQPMQVADNAPPQVRDALRHTEQFITQQIGAIDAGQQRQYFETLGRWCNSVSGQGTAAGTGGAGGTS